MKFFVFIFVLSFISSIACGYRKMSQNGKVLLNRRLRANCPITDGCTILPKDGHVLPIDVFLAKASGKLINTIYRQEGPRLDFPVTARLECKFTHDPATGLLLFTMVYRDPNFDNCTFIPEDVNGRIVPGSNRAKFDIDYFFGFGLGTIVGRYYFLSDNPDKYMILFSCRERDNIRNGICYGRYYMDIMLFGQSLDRVPWKEIACELKRKLGMIMTDDRMHFLFLGDRCPQLAQLEGIK